jgi:aminopeptidase-like protein
MDTIWTTASLTQLPHPERVGFEMYQLISKLYPFCRSLTGDGVRETIHCLQQYIPLTVHEVPTGTPVFDWMVPREWNIKDAYIKNWQGERIIDFHHSNLHVVAYSLPVKRKISLAELREHLYTLPEHPSWIPYRTSFYAEKWGFCLSHNQLLDLQDGEYEVCIDATLEPGHLTYGECYIKGETSDEVLISTHLCHPSLCNDNLSGLALVTFLASYLGSTRRRYSYRCLFIPSTIGSITWLARNESRLPRVKHGLVVACVGDSGRSTYKKTRQGNAEIDKAVVYALEHSGQDYEVLDFAPYGYDERQFCSPGFNLSVGCFMRTPHGRFPEYHTSADNLDLVEPQYLADSFTKCVMALSILESNRTYLNLNPKCEPQLGRRGLYRGYPHGGVNDLAVLWVLNLSDGHHSLLDIAKRSGLAFECIRKAATELLQSGLLKEASA